MMQAQEQMPSRATVGMPLRAHLLPEGIETLNLALWLLGQPFASFPKDDTLFLDPVTQASVSFSEVDERSQHLANQLGFVPRDHTSDLTNTRGVVLLHYPNSIELVLLVLAVLRADYTVTFAAPYATAEDIAWIVQQSQPCAIFTHLDAPQDQLALFGHLDQTTRLFGKNQYSAMYNGPYGRKVYIKPRQDKIAFILWTSGTTGKPKGLLYSHRAAIHATLDLVHGNDHFLSHETWIAFVPLQHSFGLSNVLWASLALGAKVILMTKYNPNTLLQLVQQYRATALHMAPPVVAMLANSPLVDQYDLSSVRMAISAGAPCPSELVHAVHRRLKIPVLMGYGMSETTGLTSQTLAPWSKFRRTIGTVGSPLPGVRVKIVDSNGQTLLANQEGEILVKTASLISGQIGAPGRPIWFESNQWYATGDLGRLQSGRLTITGRLKEMIKVKGHQVSPSELEGKISHHPLIADAAVIGSYNREEASEYPRAFIVPKDLTLLENPDQAERAVHDIALFIEKQCPQKQWLRGGVVLTTSILRSPAGKILRRMLDDHAKQNVSFEYALYQHGVRTPSVVPAKL
ncbi:uncharacterized protein L969DRAFT_51666 [Mixia osmundae IAM 14324]|uniref:AMP-dependent synthetase/ligase domain-containing protein n=1 Tax=Mixia osmundae (strain CBS 9802 / IAM 14324 / JCM 22182 / KY 12970) TaxID=764103 RepID=G7E0N7_MIXOS|nr:uncharacterized protein L969DRAFT_51666 [Mixia osmundae IAM 14324]KEI37873.1 hypothetical protein L969DRAFT_51666 [Mixia osmundae IAM 14324]GAA96397.1 hypothetical protein E5Q_03064 [Mixia osmundae IAM 14324]